MKRKIDHERRALTRFTDHRDLSVVIAHHALYDRQAESGSVLLGGVVRREEPGAFLFGQSLAGVRNREPDAVIPPRAGDA